ncbi:MAG: hypothetical protein ACE5FU_06395 [Nitrospinota bacterium]
MSSENNSLTHDFDVVKNFSVMTVVWVIIGPGIGVFSAAGPAFRSLNCGNPYLSFGSLTPLHVTIVVFAFGGCALFATPYYPVQGTCQGRLRCFLQMEESVMPP